MRRRKKNALDSLDQDTLDQLVQGSAESLELPDAQDAYATTEVLAEAERFEEALYSTLMDTEEGGSYVIPRKEDVLVDPDVWNEEAGYLVLMTLRGEGVGIWDGSWDHLYTDANLKKLQKYLKSKLSSYADDTGSGSLNEAMMNAAFETGGQRPEDQDFVVYQKGDRWGVHRIGGRGLGLFDTQKEMEQALKDEMKRESYWPNVWWGNERGDPDTLYEFEYVKSNPRKKTKRKVKRKAKRRAKRTGKKKTTRRTVKQVTTTTTTVSNPERARIKRRCMR